MVYDRDDYEARALRQADPPAPANAEGFPELPLGIEAFRSPLHTLPAEAPARERPNAARTVYFIVASMAVALGLFAAVAIREPTAALTEAREDLVNPEARPKPPDLPVRAVRAGALVPAEVTGAPTSRDNAAALTSAPPARPKPPASAVATATRDRAPSTTSARRANRKAEPRKSSSRARAKSSSRKIPERPSRSAVLAAMRSVTSDARSCLSGTAVAQVHITFKGETGKVLNTTVQGVQGAAASCVARAVRAARLPPFSKAQLDITFPFRAGG